MTYHGKCLMNLIIVVLVLVEAIADRMAHCVGGCADAFIAPLDHIFLNCNEQNLLRCNVLTIWDKLVDVSWLKKSFSLVTIVDEQPLTLILRLTVVLYYT